MNTKFGWFVDWDGFVRKTEAPCDGYRCDVQGNGVEVIKKDGEVIFASDYWENFEDLENCLNSAGCFVKFR